MEEYLKYYKEIKAKDTDSFDFENDAKQIVTVNLAKVVDNKVNKWVRAIVTKKGRYLVKVDNRPAEQKEAK